VRIRAWARKGCAEAIDLQAAPWITRKENEEEGAFAMCDISGALPRGEQVRVKFLESEWPIIKARIDAAFAGTDPNLSEFYVGADIRASQTSSNADPMLT
jgi:hypothetical protein